ncbi:50S ribosomal protein L25/general stress protein Ctc [Vagococcus fluvialis]|jgi:large subunit ribosomal protein L25|uniref:Large ribosomal subunit protein bL25 n=1 Tax=Vagococcus fluvialis TaxID=2738 RepID=A0A369APW1_9ENTE|nr:50S ribosomal protein L25/general stress protein Ctc [Vagococcus fluvialis]MBO0429353.1 50S ribosomal protein L25/general stress protein Ctc [Vagococcus fluvialis]MBO0478089.1 50S ribosomal protein L25/general stress protein Ctc [Vagococcus fluvialis]MBO0483202.1 50S ribosomal protein L25/general stress protein Ctc [Vagococcus fluvialis]MDT2781927.1 50S ribosomal protein L25/general stress protein Ctc [Vagococcus fluvialis]RCX11412.1 LSU ribosomal protein L25P [Vagococcus fluvialis]
MSVVLKAEKRAVRPRSIRTKLRAEGRVPSAVHGNKMENISFSVDAHELDKAIRENGLNAVYTLDLDGKKISTLLQDYQLDTFSREWIHAQFLAVDMNEEVEVEAELVLVGTSKGVKAGGVLEQNIYTVMVSATPDKLPERVEVDITEMAIGDSMVIGDLPKQDGFTIVTDAEEQICAVAELVAVEEDDEAASPAEPEVITEKAAE